MSEEQKLNEDSVVEFAKNHGAEKPGSELREFIDEKGVADTPPETQNALDELQKLAEKYEDAISDSITGNYKKTQSIMDFQSQVDEGVESDVWMGVMFTGEPNGQLTVRKTTSDFPNSKLFLCLMLLKEMMEKEVGLHEESPSPLKLAPQFQEQLNKGAYQLPHVSEQEKLLAKIADDKVAVAAKLPSHNPASISDEFIVGKGVTPPPGWMATCKQDTDKYPSGSD